MRDYVDLSQVYDDKMSMAPMLPQFSCCPVLTHEEHGGSMQQLTLVTHCGTHIDAPAHFIREGETVDTIPLSQLTGSAIVVDVSGKSPRQRIRSSDLKPYEDTLRQSIASRSNPIVLFRTDWSRFWGTDKYFDHPFLDGDVARDLVAIGIKAIGIDAMGPDETKIDVTPDNVGQLDFTAHRVVLAAGMIIAENLKNLDQIQDGSWNVSVAPLKIAGGDGSPVRAYAWKDTLEV